MIQCWTGPFEPVLFIAPRPTSEQAKKGQPLHTTVKTGACASVFKRGIASGWCSKDERPTNGPTMLKITTVLVLAGPQRDLGKDAT